MVCKFRNLCNCFSKGDFYDEKHYASLFSWNDYKYACNKNAACGKKKIDVNIFARSVSDAGTVIENEKLDALLLGPQVRFMSQQFKEKVEGSNTRVAEINMSDYGMMNVDRVLNFAMETMAEV